jgi:hypothetical protein
MTSPTPLRTYRARDIQQTATTVDEHLGRFRIYNSDEDRALAVAQAVGLAAQSEHLEAKLRRCAHPAEHTRRAEARTGYPALERGVRFMIRVTQSAARVAFVSVLLWIPAAEAAFPHEKLARRFMQRTALR